MSAAAISQHVRTLEQWLGEPLFERQARGVRLTAAGREFGATVSSSLRQVAASAEEIRGRKQRAVVRLASLPSVVAYFLTPRLPRFRALHPDIQVSISYSTTGMSTPADLTILHGRRPTESAVALFSAATRPTCAPAYLENFDRSRILRGSRRRNFCMTRPRRPGGTGSQRREHAAPKHGTDLCRFQSASDSLESRTGCWTMPDRVDAGRDNERSSERAVRSGV